MKAKRILMLSTFVASSLAVSAGDAIADELQFEQHTLDPNVGKVCYAVTLADVDADGDDDIVALTENRVVWYDQPTWTPHVILHDQTPADNVSIAPHDIDGDGFVDFAIAAGWTKTGTLHWICRSADPSALWTVAAIGEETNVHRIRWADVLGKGRPQLVVSPLNASVGNGVRLTAFEIPAQAATERWPATVLNADLNRMHNHWHVDMNLDGVIDTITASREGVHLIQRSSEGWASTKLGTGITGAADVNANGAGEIRIGRLKSGRRFLVTVEPMHGDHLAVYVEPKLVGGEWTRQIIDSGFARGHALSIADFNGDGSDDIAFGHSDTPQVHGVHVYCSDIDDETRWHRTVVDAGGMATEDLVAADLTGDGKPDIAAGGRATHNLKLYINAKK